jgi:asparagine synthase (glutamine-hydrolysing)
MCGICGYFGGHGAMNGTVLERMNNTLTRRGPDEGGAFCQAGVGIAMRRLSIIDLAGGRQPIHNEDQTVWVVFNGEIYNYRELREDLLRRGHRFETNSDTEVIVHGYEEYGDRVVDHLRGMFSFAIWDAPRRRGLLARDRLGIKPLFYSIQKDTLVFGSEIKAVLASGLVSKDLDIQALDAFLTYTYIPAPLTIYRDVRKLEPGHVLVFDQGKVEIRRYWDLDMTQVERDVSEQEWTERFNAAIESAVESHMVSDVPVGAFLSGGIDSGLVVAMMSRHMKEPVQTFTMGFGGSSAALIDERPLARQIADRYGCSFNAFDVQPDFRGIVGEIVSAFDEPFADDSVIPSYYVSQLTRQNVKVAMSGLGGDELFAGYDRYSGVYLSQYYAAAMPSCLHRGIVQPLVNRLPEQAHGGNRVDHAKRFAESALLSPSRRYLRFVSTLDAPGRGRLFRPDVAKDVDFDATDRLVTEPFEKCNAPDDLARALYADMKTYLPEDILALSDRLSMWHSLELRVPLIDHPLVELSARLPSRFKLNLRRKKILLRKIAQRHLPDAVLNHRKQGFESPMGAWLKTDLAGYAGDVLGRGRFGKSGLFNEDFVSDRLNEHATGRRKNNKLLFSLIMLQEWFERQV